MNVKPEFILQGINGMLKNRKLYPAGHPSHAMMTKKSFNLITSHLVKNENLFFGIINETFVFGDFPILDAEKSYDELIEKMVEKEVEAVIVEQDFTESELKAATDILTGEDIYNQEELEEILKIKGVTHIKLKKVPKERRSPLQIYDDAIEAVKGFMGEARMGKIPSSKAVNEIVTEMTDTILSDPNAMLGLTMIRDYDEYLYTHCVNVGLISISVGKSLGLDKEDLYLTGLGGLLHDIGKIAVSEDIINKPGGLSSEEWEKLKKHPVMGSTIAKKMDGIDPRVSRIIYEHHIKYDHTGYPTSTDKLHPSSFIVAISDTYDALTTLRVYQRPYQPIEAARILRDGSGRHYDPRTLEAFIRVIGLYPIGTLLKLGDGSLGIVITPAHTKEEDVTVKVVVDPKGEHLDPPEERVVDAKAKEDIDVIMPENPIYSTVDKTAFFIEESRQVPEEKEEEGE